MCASLLAEVGARVPTAGSTIPDAETSDPPPLPTFYFLFLLSVCVSPPHILPKTVRARARRHLTGTTVQTPTGNTLTHVIIY